MIINNHPDFEEVILTHEAIQAHVEKLAATINLDYIGKTPIVMAVLKGVFPFLADISKHFTFYCDYEFIAASSYHGGIATTDWVELYLWPRQTLKGRDILLIEDIVDSGLTLKKIKQKLLSEGVKSVKIATFIDKPGGRKTSFEADYVGVTIKPLFVAGYGLDFQEKYRNIPFVGVLKDHIIHANPRTYPWKNHV
jgi:hypoxanthine phosphoribosyltransferase